MDDRNHIAKDVLDKPSLGHLEKVKIKTPRSSMLGIKNYNTPGKYECAGIVTPKAKTKKDGG